MISFVDFFRPASLRTAAFRYAVLCVIRILWGLFIGSDRAIVAYLHPFDSREALNLVYSITALYMPLGVLLNFALWMAQAVLLWRMFRLIGKDPEEIKAQYKTAGSWLATPLLLSSVVILTCCIIGWLVQTGGIVRFLPQYLVYYSSTPVAVGLVLSLLGSMFGGRFVAGAKASMGGLFGIHYLPKDHPLSQRVARHAETLGLPTAPAVGIVDVMNAFAIGTPKDSTIVLGQPLMDIITDEELDAVIGHELGHVFHNDMNRMQFAEGFQRMLGSVISATTIILVSALSRNRSDAMLGRVAGTALRQTVFVGSELVVKGISRAREFHADAVGARIASPAAMIGALERLHGLPSQPTKLESQYGYLMFRGSRLGAWFSTHPHVEKRIKALRSLKDLPESDTTPEAVLHPKVDAMAGTAAMKLGSALDTAKTGLANASTSLAFADRSQAAWVSASSLLGKVPSPRFGMKTAIMAVAGIGAVVLVAPAIYDYYQLDEKTAALTLAANDSYQSIGQSIADLSNWTLASVTNYDEQLAEKENTIKGRDAQISALHRSLNTMRSELRDARLSGNEARAEVSRLTTENLRLSEGQSSGALYAERNALLARVSRLEGYLRVARRNNAPSDLLAQIEQQRSTIASLQKQLNGGVSPTAVVEDTDTLRLLKERNAQLTEETGQQMATITALERDLATYKAKVEQVTAEAVSKRFIAFAASQDGTVFLTERGFDTEAEARSAAMLGCLKFSRDKSCEVKRSFSDTCVSVARVAPGNRASGWQLSFGNSSSGAEDNALSDCYNEFNKRCMITVPGVCTKQ